MNRAFRYVLLTASALAILSCQYNLDEPRITGISAITLGKDTVLFVPDSSLITCNRTNKELQMVVRFFGCNPAPTAHCEWDNDTMLVLFKMNDRCIHDMVEYFEIKISVAPVTESKFRLMVAPTYGNGWNYSDEFHLIDSLIAPDKLCL